MNFLFLIFQLDKEKLFKDNIVLINENYKLNNQVTFINNNLKSIGVTKDNFKEIIDKINVLINIYQHFLNVRWQKNN